MKAFGTVKGGKLKLNNSRQFQDSLREFEGKDVELRIRERSANRSKEQNGLYWTWIDILSKDEESLKITFEKFSLLQKKWNSTGYVPITENNNIWQSYQHHVELFYDYIKLNKDLRDLDFKRNFEEKTQILEKAKKLLKESSINIAHKVLQELHEHWKNIGPVEREQRDIIWKKFQLISKEINTKRNDYFLTLKQQNKQ